MAEVLEHINIYNTNTVTSTWHKTNNASKYTIN